MLISRASHWLLGTAMAAALVYFASVATAESVADAFEPDLDSWEALR
ncbi:MAG: thiazole synthase [Candidatus Sericytochromatia bacterium]